MLKKIRLTLAILFFAAITLLFVDFTGTAHAWLGWMAKIQFLPAVLALNVGVIVALVALTLIFGRIYCSVICPLGVMQDVITWINSKRGKKQKRRFSYSPAKSLLRYVVLALFVVALVAGIGSVAALLAPYSSYGRIANNLLAPVYGWGNNLLAYFAERADSYAFYTTDVWLKSLPTFIIAIATFIIIAALAWRNGRTYCNTICPVGTVLGFLSKYSLFKISIDTDKCRNCSLCSRQCKASCIDYKNHAIDYSRCVDCMDCIGSCEFGAISYGIARKPKAKETNQADAKQPSNEPVPQTDTSRRTFIVTAIATVTAVTRKSQEKIVDGGRAVIEDKQIPDRRTHIEPPGAVSLKHFAQHCTACQLCVSVCPNGVLRPSTDLTRLMQPEVSYERGYCRPECNKCSQVCPAGAIRPVTVAEKSAIHIGHAVWTGKNCIPLTDGQECGNCARHCPTGAIIMVPSDKSNPDSLKIPIVNEERCIGCGACENLCPARPFSAIHVEGNEVHFEQ